MAETDTYWTVSLFGVGDVGHCVLAWCCMPCAISLSRHQLDVSNDFFFV